MSSHEDETTPLVPRENVAPSGGSESQDQQSTVQQLADRPTSSLRGILHTWLKVLPFCIINVGLVLLLNYGWEYSTQNKEIVERLWIGTAGHQYTGALVAFLLVSRMFLSLQRFNSAHYLFEALCQDTRELVQTMITLTSEDKDQSSKEWRSEVAYRSLLLLRTTVAVLEFQDSGVLAWEIPELDGFELDSIQQNILTHPDNASYVNILHIQEGFLSQIEESMRVPIKVGHLLRKSIVKQNTALLNPLLEEEEMALLSLVDSACTRSHCLKDFVSAPPFLYFQTTRSLLFIYIFSFPFSLVSLQWNDELSLWNILVQCFTVFLVTFTVMGLEIIANGLGNPFSQRISLTRFNCLSIAQHAFEDVYLDVFNCDGRQYSDNLRYTMDSDSSDPVAREPLWLFRCTSIHFRDQKEGDD